METPPQPTHSVAELRSRLKQAGFGEDQIDLFLEEAGETLVAEYIEDFKSFFDALPKDSPNATQHESCWDAFIVRSADFEWLTTMLYIRDDSNLKRRALKLAFLRNHPQFYVKPEINSKMMLRALEAKTDQEARTILEIGLLQASGSILSKGYDSPFLRSDIIVQPILKTLNDYTKKWKPSDYDAPYATLMGPSMSGKTRLVMEMSQHICVVHVCLRAPDSDGGGSRLQDFTGYPPRSALAEHILMEDRKDINAYYKSLIASILQVVANFFNQQDPGMKKKDRLKAWNDYTEVASLGTLARSDRTQKKFTGDVLEEMEKPRLRNYNRLNEAVIAMSNSTQFINTGSSTRVLLAFDEARALVRIPGPYNEISLFDTFRHTIRNIAPDKGFFAVLVDTIFPVADLSIASQWDPCPRYDLVRQEEHFAPIYEIASFDAMVPTEPPRSWEQLVSLERLLNYGFPIFGAYFRDALAEQQDPYQVYEAILRLAHSKLRGAARHSLTKAQAFAFLGPTIQPRIKGAFHLNAELIGAHAALCDHISPGCDMVFSNYPSQFTFAAAVVYSMSKEKWIQCIKALTKHGQHGLDDWAGAGYLASRIILLHAMQVSMNRSMEEGAQYGRPVRLVNFLEVLTGKEAKHLDLGSIDPDQKEDLLKHGMIFWNHFSRITYSPRPDELLQFMYRGTAAQCDPIKCGLDQIFTIYLKRDSDDLDEKNISYCGIQAKNREFDLELVDDDYVKTNTYSPVKLQNNNPYLILHMNLNNTKDGRDDRPTPTPKNDDSSPDKRQATLVFDGLHSYDWLNQPLIDALEELINVEPGFEQLQSDEIGKHYTKLINPCQG
ncbi:hypothetical protein PSTG_03556 [Puccinia striiformis f. sp. tritici PST-78]|uniref:Uncharacterized protein n=1 Tax=Puccinia striiformis f. sp. tritici PST-78 TaxID=1165861 RepID=A0A0L0VVF6_9BASI|nr:hypothetical protein PSTG_03556 [Puccinia striiformis f. sp. tritici PST-78]